MTEQQQLNGATVCVVCPLRIEELASRYKWMCLKKILLEYGITDTPSVNVTWNLVRLMVVLYATVHAHWRLLCILYLIQNSQAVKKKSAALKMAMVKKDVKSEVAVKKWL